MKASVTWLLAALAAALIAPAGAAELEIDKEKRTIVVPAKVAPRKIDDPAYKEVYPLEVIATYPFPKGKKAHETVVTFDVKPSQVHQALLSLGLKPGKPAKGLQEPQSGPEVLLFLDLTPGKGGRRVPVEQFLVDRKTGKAMPRVRWLFTGSSMIRTDPDKPVVFGADETGTLITIFPVTSETVFQSSLSLKDEKYVKLEASPKLPPVGTVVHLVIVVPAN